MTAQKRFSSGEVAQQDATIDALCQKSAARLLGISVRTLRDELAPRNPDGTYNGVELLRWFNQRYSVVSATEQAKERMAIARAEKLEYETAKAKGELIDRHEVIDRIDSIVAVVRDRFLRLPEMVANDIPADLRARLMGELHNGVRQILRILATQGQQLADKIRNGEEI